MKRKKKIYQIELEQKHENLIPNYRIIRPHITRIWKEDGKSATAKEILTRSTARIWNQVPQAIKGATTLNLAKKLIKNYCQTLPIYIYIYFFFKMLPHSVILFCICFFIVTHSLYRLIYIQITQGGKRIFSPCHSFFETNRKQSFLASFLSWNACRFFFLVSPGVPFVVGPWNVLIERITIV